MQPDFKSVAMELPDLTLDVANRCIRAASLYLFEFGSLDKSDKSSVPVVEDLAELFGRLVNQFLQSPRAVSVDFVIQCKNAIDHRDSAPLIEQCASNLHITFFGQSKDICVRLNVKTPSQAR